MTKRSPILKLGFISGAVLLALLLYYREDARYSGFYPVCPFHYFTGLYCPGCGSQRAISALLHGDLLQAVRFNVLLLTSLPLIMYSAVISVVNAFRKKPLVQRFVYAPHFVWACLGLIVLFGICRNIPVYPFVLLAANG